MPLESCFSLSALDDNQNEIVAIEEADHSESQGKQDYIELVI